MTRLTKRHYALLAVGLFWAVGGVPVTARATPLSSHDFEELAARCAPTESVKILAGVARTESGLDPLALHDNTTGASVNPASAAEAAVLAIQWIGEGHSVDVGLMQINSANLSPLNLTSTAALDACSSLVGGAAILKAAYGNANDIGGDQKVALLMALSRYNTGSPIKGILNGYSRRVISNINNNSAVLPAKGEASAALSSSWDVWKRGSGNPSQVDWIVTTASTHLNQMAASQPAIVTREQSVAANSVAILFSQPTTRFK